MSISVLSHPPLTGNIVVGVSYTSMEPLEEIGQPSLRGNLESKPLSSPIGGGWGNTLIGALV